MDVIDKSYRDLLRNSADLCAFVMVCRAGNMTRAAGQLGISQPSLSKRVRNLELAVGTELLIRTSKGVTPTDAGARLFEAVAEGFDSIAASFGQHKGTQQPESILVCADFAFATYWLLPRLPRLRKEIGQTEIRILASQTPLLEPQDSAIQIFMADIADTLETDHSLFHEKVSAICSPDLLAGSTPSQILSQAPLLHLSSPRPETAWLDWPEWLEAQGFDPSRHLPGTEFNSYDMAIRAALEGQGIALGWHGLIDDYLTSGELVTLLHPIERPNIRYFARMAVQSRTVEALLDWIRT